MSKFSAKKIKFDPNNLFNSVGNLSVKFSDSEAASSVLAWSSEKIKAYIDNVAQGLDSKNSCRAMTTSALPSCTYDNGTSGVGATLTGSVNGTLADQDGVTLVVSDRLLVKNQDTKSQNGIYEVTTVGDASNPFVLTRTSDFDDSPDGEVSGGAYCFIQEGSVGEDTGWVLTTNGSITIGTTELDFSQFSGTGQITSGVGLTKDGSTVQIGDGNTGNKNGISRTSSDIGIATGIGVEVNSDLLRLASTAAGDALTGGSGTTLSVVASDLTGAGLEDDGSNNIRISSTAAGDGLQGGSGSALAIDVADFAGTGLEESGGDLRISTSAAGDGITGGSGAALSVVSDTIGGSSLSTSINVSANGVAVKIDDNSIGENASHQLEVKDGGININQINSSIAGDGLQGGSGSALAVDVSDFAGTGLEDDGSENLRIATSAAGDGLTGGGGSAITVQSDVTTVDTHLASAINVVANGISVKIDDSSIGENASHQLEVKDGGITESHLNSSIAGNGLTGGAGSALAIDVNEYIKDGSNEIDGDKIDIDWTPSNYTPSTSPVEVSNIDNLTAHLYGIDMAFLDISSEQTVQEMHKIQSNEDTNGYFTLSHIPSNAQSVRATIVEGHMVLNNAADGLVSSGEIPDFEILNLTEFHFNDNGAASGLSGILEADDVLIIEYVYEIETGMDSNGDLMPYIGSPSNSTNIFEENGPSAIMPTTSGTNHDFFEIVGGEITPKE